MPKPKKKQKRPLQSPVLYRRLMKMAVDTYNAAVRKRGSCISCGAKTKLSCGHLISARNARTRFHSQNCWPQCFGCNKKHEYNPELMTHDVINIIGAEDYLALVKFSKLKKIFTFAELGKIIMLHDAP